MSGLLTRGFWNNLPVPYLVPMKLSVLLEEGGGNVLWPLDSMTPVLDLGDRVLLMVDIVLVSTSSHSLLLLDPPVSLRICFALHTFNSFANQLF